MVDSHAVLSVLVLLVASISGISGYCEKESRDRTPIRYCNGGDISDLAELPDNIERIYISDMKVTKLSADMLKRFTKLLVFSCSNCSIREIEPGAFHKNHLLQLLTLNNNYLTTVKADWFQGLVLTSLDLTYNNITSIEPDVYKRIKYLRELRLSGNPIECLDTKAMRELESVMAFYLDQVPTFKCQRRLAEFFKELRKSSPNNIAVATDETWKEIQVSEQEEEKAYEKIVEAAEKTAEIVSMESTSRSPVTQKPLEFGTSEVVDVGTIITTNAVFWQTEPKTSTPKPVTEAATIPSTTKTPQNPEETTPVVSVTFTSVKAHEIYYPPPAAVPTTIMPQPTPTDGEPYKNESAQFIDVMPLPHVNETDSQPGEQHEPVSPTTSRQTVAGEEDEKQEKLCNDAGQGLRNAGRYAIGIFVVVFCLSSL